MSDTTTLYEKGPHNCLEPHPWPQSDATSTLVAGPADWCPGGRERTLEQVDKYFNGQRYLAWRTEWELVEVSDVE